MEKEKEKELVRAKVFDQMKDIEETRRQSFIDIATAKADISPVSCLRSASRVDQPMALVRA